MKKNLILKLGTVAVLTVSAFGHMGENYENQHSMHNTKKSSSGMYNQNMMGQGMMNGHMMNGNMMGQGMTNGHMMNRNMMGQGMMNGHMMNGNMMGQGMMNGHMILPTIMTLNLSEEQLTKIHEILRKKENKSISLKEVFSKSSFNKDKYLQLVELNRKSALESYAEKLSQIHFLLTKKQKEELKRRIDYNFSR